MAIAIITLLQKILKNIKLFLKIKIVTLVWFTVIYDHFYHDFLFALRQ